MHKRLFAKLGAQRMQYPQVLDYAAVAVTLLFFAVGSVYDLKTREVSDKVWVVYGLCGLALTVVRLSIEPSTIVLSLVSIGITTGVSMALFYFGLFGGADAKATICLALAVPVIPNIVQPLIGYLHPFFPIVVLISGFVCSISVSVWLGIENLGRIARKGFRIFDGLQNEPWWDKALGSITGYPTGVTNLRSTFYLYPMEEIATDSFGRSYRKFHFFFGAEADREKLVSEYVASLAKVGSPQTVWVSPGLPMLVFMFIGLIITLFAGDIVFRGIFSLAFH